MENLPERYDNRFSIGDLLAQAIEKNTPVDTIERLLAVAKEMKQEYAREEYYKSLAAFQSECPVIIKTKEVRSKSGILLYRYAPLESIVDQVKEILYKHGFSYSIDTFPDGDKLTAVIYVYHTAGYTKDHRIPVSVGVSSSKVGEILSPSQLMAVGLTYAKRYLFCNAFGILTGDEDIDGKIKVEEEKQYISNDRIKVLMDLLSQTNYTNEDILSRANVTSFEQLTAFQGERIIQNLERIIEKGKNNG